MAPADFPQQSDDDPGRPPLRCDACASAFESSGRPSFLLLDRLTVPLVGCRDHLARFADVCGYTTKDTAELLEHRPAGGIGCPSCHLAPHNPHHPVVPVEDGAVAVLACPDHQSELVDRFHTGLDTHHRITTQLDTA